MNKINTLEHLKDLIAAGVMESTTLEYKSAIDTRTDGWKKEMAKDVSAMANSNGGTIIYGIKEYDDPCMKHLPERISPFDTTNISKETISLVIANNIAPRIKGVEILCIVVDDTKPNEVVFVLTFHKAILRIKIYAQNYIISV